MKIQFQERGGDPIGGICRLVQSLILPWLKVDAEVQRVIQNLNRDKTNSKKNIRTVDKQILEAGKSNIFFFFWQSQAVEQLNIKAGKQVSLISSREEGRGRMEGGRT